MSLQNDMLVFRAQQRMSQTELAKAVGVSLQTINSIENGHQSPSKLTEQKIRLVIGSETKGEQE